MDTFLFSCERAARLALGIYAFVGMMVGLLVYGLLVYAQYRRPQFRDWGTVRRGPAALVALGLFLVIIALGYWTSLAGFYRVQVKDDMVEVRYIMPERTLLLPRAEITSLAPVFAYKNRWHLRLKTRSGKTLQSAPGTEYQVSFAVERLNCELFNRPAKFCEDYAAAMAESE